MLECRELGPQRERGGQTTGHPARPSSASAVPNPTSPPAKSQRSPNSNALSLEMSERTKGLGRYRYWWREGFSHDRGVIGKRNQNFGLHRHHHPTKSYSSNDPPTQKRRFHNASLTTLGKTDLVPEGGFQGIQTLTRNQRNEKILVREMSSVSSRRLVRGAFDLDSDT